MGYYIQTDGNTDKAKFICDHYDAIPISLNEAEILSKDEEGPLAAIVVVDNGILEAAAYCYRFSEFIEFANLRDIRPKTWLAIDRNIANKLTGYKQ